MKKVLKKIVNKKTLKKQKRQKSKKKHSKNKKDKKAKKTLKKQKRQKSIKNKKIKIRSLFDFMNKLVIFFSFWNDQVKNNTDDCCKSHA